MWDEEEYLCDFPSLQWAAGIGLGVVVTWALGVPWPDPILGMFGVPVGLFFGSAARKMWG